MSDKVGISKQKLDLDEKRIYLHSEMERIKYQIKVIERGMEELDNGENMLESGSILAQEVRKVMREL